jgi:hypothetical protein
MNKIVERRQRAREAVQDSLASELFRGDAELAIAAAEIAIETATRVQMTPEIEAAAYDAIDRTPYVAPEYLTAIIIAAFGAAGFEVEQ